MSVVNIFLIIHMSVGQTDGHAILTTIFRMHSSKGSRC